MITYQDLEQAGYVVNKNGTITDKDGSVMRNKMYDGKPTVRVYVGHMKEYRSSFTNVRVHRMVAEKFLENPNNYRFVAFKNGNPAQPRATNLVWTELRIARSQHKTYTNKRLAIILLETGEIGWQEAAKKYGIDQSLAYKIWRKANATV